MREAGATAEDARAVNEYEASRNHRHHGSALPR